jgi:hypothetical protein
MSHFIYKNLNGQLHPHFIEKMPKDITWSGIEPISLNNDIEIREKQKILYHESLDLAKANAVPVADEFVKRIELECFKTTKCDSYSMWKPDTEKIYEVDLNMKIEKRQHYYHKHLSFEASDKGNYAIITKEEVKEEQESQEITYEIADFIRLSYIKHCNNSWLSIAKDLQKEFTIARK